MAVSRQSPPAAVAELIANTLDRLDGDVRTFDRSFREMSEPLPLYTVSAEQLASRGGARDLSVSALLTQIGWRSVITTQEGEPSLADVKSKNDELRFARLVSGDRVSAMISAAAACEEFADQADYELRIIESPSMKLGAIWLAGEQSLFMPFAGLPQSPIPESEFIRALLERGGGGRHPSSFGGLLGAGLALGAVAALAAALRGLVGDRASRRPVATASEQADEE